MKRTRVLIVDDSRTMRSIIAAKLQKDPDIEVVAGVSNPYEAREAIKALNPDVITLDNEMPRMTGLEFLEKIMRLRPTPVVMISANTQEGAKVSLAALEMGAFECIGKPKVGDYHNAFSQLPQIIHAAAKSAPNYKDDDSAVEEKDDDNAKSEAAAEREGFVPSDKVVVIGASTGGVEALRTVLANFPKNCPPTVIVQHMPENFTGSFARRLDRQFAPDVVEATHNALLKPGRVFIAPGGLSHLEISGTNQLKCRIVEGDRVSGHRPSVDVLFNSVAKLGPRVVAAQLTGMGRDGANGMLAIRQANGATFGQDAATSVVYGMPKVAFDIGAVQRQLPLEKIGRALIQRCDASAERMSA